MSVDVAAVDDNAHSRDGDGDCSKPTQQRQELWAKDAVFGAVVLGVEVMRAGRGCSSGVVNGEIRILGHGAAIVDPRSVDKHDRKQKEQFYAAHAG